MDDDDTYMTSTDDAMGYSAILPTTDNVEFISYKTLLDSFFSDKDAFKRLQKIESKRKEEVFPIIVHFVKHYEGDKVRQNKDGYFLRISDMYSTAITSHKKRYYDFCSVFGKGELVYNGKVNPYVSIKNGDEEVVSTLPCLIAVWWFLRYDFDFIFWDEYEEVKKMYHEYTNAMKKQYSAAHKAYNSEIKKAAVERVINNRPLSSNITTKNKKKPLLSAAERRLVSEFMEQERMSRKNKNGPNKAKQPTKKQKKKDGAPVMLVGAGVFGEDDDF